MPVASERMPVSVMVTHRYPFSLGCSLVWATRWPLQPSLLAPQPFCWHCQRRIWVGTPTNQGHFPASSHSRTTLLVGPVPAGPKGPPIQVVTSLLFLEPQMEGDSHLPLWAVTSLWSWGLPLC